MSLEPVDLIHCQIGESLLVAFADDRVYVASRITSEPEEPSEPVMLLTPGEAHWLGTKLRLAAKKAGHQISP